MTLEYDWDYIREQHAKEAEKYYLGREVRWRCHPRPRGHIVDIDPANGLFSARYRVKWIEGYSKDETSNWLGSYDLLIDE